MREQVTWFQNFCGSYRKKIARFTFIHTHFTHTSHSRTVTHVYRPVYWFSFHLLYTHITRLALGRSTQIKRRHIFGRGDVCSGSVAENQIGVVWRWSDVVWRLSGVVVRVIDDIWRCRFLESGEIHETCVARVHHLRCVQRGRQWIIDRIWANLRRWLKVENAKRRRSMAVDTVSWRRRLEVDQVPWHPRFKKPPSAPCQPKRWVVDIAL